jgi:O-methyltransferase
MNLPHRLKTKAKLHLAPLLYKFPPVFLTPAGQYLWFDAFAAVAKLDGAIVEIGCYLGPTAAISSKFLSEIGSKNQYYVIDTFGGFVEEQFDSKAKYGGGASLLRHHFTANTPDLARWVMDKHGGKNVKIIQGDITKLQDNMIPDRIAACLIDIDLADPIYESLHRIYPRMIEGGRIIVDDCDDETLYKARIGYDRFVEEKGLKRNIRFGKGLIVKEA